MFTKLTDINESNARKITELEKQVANTKDARAEKTGITNYIEEPSSGPERTIHGQPECNVTPPGGGKVKLYSEIVKGTTTQSIQTNSYFQGQPNSRPYKRNAEITNKLDRNKGGNKMYQNSKGWESTN